MILRKSVYLLLALALCVFGSVSSAVAAKNFQNLAFVTPYVERHPTSIRSWFPFFERAKAETNGQLSFNFFAPNMLYPEKEAFSAVSDGRTDLGTVRASMFPGSMNLMGVMDISGVSPNAIVGSIVGQELVEKFPEVQAEFPANTVPFFAWASASYQIHTIMPVKNLADLRGKKIIVWDAASLETAKLLGASPVRIDGPDTYMALSKAMADGVLCPIAPVRSLKISEACKYHLVVNLGTASFNMLINKDLWNSMPDNLQQWMKANGGMALSIDAGKSLEDGQRDDIEWMMQNGHTFFYPTEAERAEFLEKLLPIREAWIKHCVARGISETVARDVLKFVDERVAFHTEEMRKGVYGDYKI